MLFVVIARSLSHEHKKVIATFAEFFVGMICAERRERRAILLFFILQFLTLSFMLIPFFGLICRTVYLLSKTSVMH